MMRISLLAKQVHLRFLIETTKGEVLLDGMLSTLSLQPVSNLELCQDRETSKRSYHGLHADCTNCKWVCVNHRRSPGNVPGALSSLAEHVSFNQQLTQQTQPTRWVSTAGYDCDGSTLYSLKPSSVLPDCGSVIQTGCHHSHWIKYGGWYEASHWQMRQIMKKNPWL